MSGGLHGKTRQTYYKLFQFIAKRRELSKILSDDLEPGWISKPLADVSPVCFRPAGSGMGLNMKS